MIGFVQPNSELRHLASARMWNSPIPKELKSKHILII